MTMIREKLKGHKPIIAAAPERGNVINLMDALKASLSQSQAAGEEQEQGRARCEKPTAKVAAGGARQGARQGQEVTAAAGKIFGTVGALAAFPRRLAVREVQRQHGLLMRGVTRRTSHIVFGRMLLAKADHNWIEARIAPERKAGRRLLSENAFLRLLGLIKAPDASAMTRQSLLDQSRLGACANSISLSLFDAFEHDAEPYSFRDLILAKKYAGLIASGATWSAIARSVHRYGPGRLAHRQIAARRRIATPSMRASSEG